MEELQKHLQEWEEKINPTEVTEELAYFQQCQTLLIQLEIFKHNNEDEKFISLGKSLIETMSKKVTWKTPKIHDNKAYTYCNNCKYFLDERACEYDNCYCCKCKHPNKQYDYCCEFFKNYSQKVKPSNKFRNELHKERVEILNSSTIRKWCK